ncbi:MAG: hypothetical protein M9894_11015 [Planctomycetes bacterium]|nr:hypothetical protein [Planctomycetota bacterium]
MKKILTALVVGIGLTLTGCPGGDTPTGGGGAAPDATGGDGATAPDTPATPDNGGDATPAAPTATKPDLSHVTQGQKYHYTLTNPGAPPMSMVYEVTEVGDNLVKYEISTIMDMGQGPAPVGPPTPQEWKYEPVATTDAAPSDAPKAEISREKVEISGITFDCMVVTSGNSKSWVPATGDLATFPGVVKTQTDGATTMELTKIE